MALAGACPWTPLQTDGCGIEQPVEDVEAAAECLGSLANGMLEPLTTDGCGLSAWSKLPRWVLGASLKARKKRWLWLEYLREAATERFFRGLKRGKRHA